MKTNFNKISEDFLEKKAISYSTLQPTNTALKKSIIDCVFSVREYFKKNNFHDYALQKQGPSNKIIKECSIITPKKTIKTKVSLYVYDAFVLDGQSAADFTVSYFISLTDAESSTLCQQFHLITFSS